jgi:DNA-binding MarR family transcriptional regulator
MYFIIYVGKHPECTPSELTSALKLDWGHSQRSVAKLAEDGFLIKEKKSGRSYRLTLTPLGKQAFDVCHQVLFDWDAGFVFVRECKWILCRFFRRDHFPDHHIAA